jgi:hypothetical protein
MKSKTEKSKRIRITKQVRSSKLAEAENIRLHDEYYKKTKPEMMGDYFNS